MPGRKANGAKLPSEELRLNASKSEFQPDKIDDTLGAMHVGRQQYDLIDRFRRQVWCKASVFDHKHDPIAIMLVLYNQMEVMSVLAQNRL